MILDIIKYDDLDSFKLRKKNIDVKKENPFLQTLIRDMFETLDYNKSYFGLSAPQVGHNLNLFVIKLPNIQEVFINPEIYYEGLSLSNKENCPSFPSLEFSVNRREKVQVKYFDRNWVLRHCTYKELEAIIIQHEYDHICGKLISD